MNRFKLKRRISPSTAVSEGDQGDRGGNDGEDSRGTSNDKRLRSDNSVGSTGGPGLRITDGSAAGAVQHSSESTSSAVTNVLDPQPKVSKIAQESVAVNPLDGLKTRGSGNVEERDGLNVADDGADGLCLVCRKNISQYNAQRRTQHINRCIDRVCFSSFGLLLCIVWLL